MTKQHRIEVKPNALANVKWGHSQYNWGPVTIRHRKTIVKAFSIVIIKDPNATWEQRSLKDYSELYGYLPIGFENDQTQNEVDAWLDTHSYLRQIVPAINIILRTRGFRLVETPRGWVVVKRKGRSEAMKLDR